MAALSTVPSQCGMRIISGLSADDDITHQIDLISQGFKGYPHAFSKAAQVIITDAVATEKSRWKETKILAFKGPVKTNPNSRRGICVYICTRETLSALKKYRAALKEGEPDIKQFIPKYSPNKQ